MRVCVCLLIWEQPILSAQFFFVFLVNLKTTLKKSLLIKKQSDMTCEIQDKAHPQGVLPS